MPIVDPGEDFATIVDALIAVTVQQVDPDSGAVTATSSNVTCLKRAPLTNEVGTEAGGSVRQERCRFVLLASDVSFVPDERDRIVDDSGFVWGVDTASIEGLETLYHVDTTRNATNAPDPTTQDLFTGLVNCYRFDGNGYDAASGTPAASEMTFSDVPVYGSGLLGSALTSGGPGTAAVDPGSVWSLTGWLFIGSAFSGTGGRVAIEFVDLDTVVISGVEVICSGSVTRFDFGDVQSYSLSAGWHHFAITNTGSAGGLLRYVDGQQVGSAGTVPVGDVNQLAVAPVGDNAENAVDQVMVYGVALTAEKVAAAYDSGAGFDPTDIVPVPVSAATSVTGEDVFLTLNMAVDGILDGSLAFVVKANGTDLGFFIAGAVLLPGNVLQIHADIAFVPTGQTVTLDYVPGTVETFGTSKALAAFVGFPVTNNVP